MNYSFRRCLSSNLFVKYEHSVEFAVVASFVQIYMESVFDLLSGDLTPLTIREDFSASPLRTNSQTTQYQHHHSNNNNNFVQSSGTGIFIDQLTQVAITHPMQLLELISVGTQNRAAAATLMVNQSFVN